MATETGMITRPVPKASNRCKHVWKRRDELIRRDLTPKQENARHKANQRYPGNDDNVTLSATATYDKCCKCGNEKLVDYKVN